MLSVIYKTIFILIIPFWKPPHRGEILDAPFLLDEFKATSFLLLNYNILTQ